MIERKDAFKNVRKLQAILGTGWFVYEMPFDTYAAEQLVKTMPAFRAWEEVLSTTTMERILDAGFFAKSVHNSVIRFRPTAGLMMAAVTTVSHDADGPVSVTVAERPPKEVCEED